jgi:hypothetical protein
VLLFFFSAPAWAKGTGPPSLSRRPTVPLRSFPCRLLRTGARALRDQGQERLFPAIPSCIKRAPDPRPNPSKFPPRLLRPPPPEPSIESPLAFPSSEPRRTLPSASAFPSSSPRRHRTSGQAKTLDGFSDVPSPRWRQDPEPRTAGTKRSFLQTPPPELPSPGVSLNLSVL